MPEDPKSPASAGAMHHMGRASGKLRQIMILLHFFGMLTLILPQPVLSQILNPPASVGQQAVGAPSPEITTELTRRAGRVLDAARQIGFAGANLSEIQSILSAEAIGIGGARAVAALEREDWVGAREGLTQSAMDLLSSINIVTSRFNSTSQVAATSRINNTVRRALSEGQDPAAFGLSPTDAIVPTVDHSAVVMLEHSSTALCTGAYVEGGWVLTAAHCICPPADYWNQPLYPTYEECRNPLNSNMAPGEWRVYFQHAGVFRVSRIVVSPRYFWTSLSGDIALFQLQSPPNWIRPMSIELGVMQVEEFRARVIGFGYAGGGTNPIAAAAPGIKTSTVTSVRPCTTASASYLRPEAHLCHVFRQGMSGAICSGDSGGPLVPITSSRSFSMAVASGNNRGGSAPVNPALGAACGNSGSVGLHTRTTFPAAAQFIAGTLAGTMLDVLPDAFPAIGTMPGGSVLLGESGARLVMSGSAAGALRLPVGRPSAARPRLAAMTNGEGPIVTIRLVARQPNVKDETLLCEANGNDRGRALHCYSDMPVAAGSRLALLVTGKPRSLELGLPESPPLIQAVVVELPQQSQTP